MCVVCQLATVSAAPVSGYVANCATYVNFSPGIMKAWQHAVPGSFILSMTGH